MTQRPISTGIVADSGQTDGDDRLSDSAKDAGVMAASWANIRHRMH
ncbi:hypothetical protein ACLK1U_22395 [Escherichia coli]